MYAIPYLISKIDSDQEKTLRNNFFNALNSVQSTSLRWQNRPIVTFENEGLVDHLIQKNVWSQADKVNFDSYFAIGQRPELERLTHEALGRIRNLSVSTAELIDLTIAEFCLLRKAGRGGGSVSSLIGMVWLNPQPSWNVDDLSEVILHEWVHHALFLEDMVRKIFASSQEEMDSAEGLVRSAVLRVPRSLDKSFHSLAVTLCVGAFRDAIGDDVGATEARRYCGTTIDDLRTKKHMLTEHGQSLLNEMVQYWEAT